MPLVLKDRVRETTATLGTGTVTLAGAVVGYQSFAQIGDGNTTYYCIANPGVTEWEVGIGTYTASGTTLSRDTVLASSAGAPNKTNFSAGSKDVFVTYPAGKSVYADATDIVNITTLAATTVGATTGNITTVNATTVDATNIEVTNIKAKDGTSAIAIADTTGITTQSTPAVIAVNSSSDALRITQTGGGNALVVEDSANPDSTPFVIDASGQVITGNTTAVAFTYASAPRIEVIGTSQSTSSIAAATFNGTAGVASAMLLGRGRGTAAAPTIVSSGDDIGLIQFESHDGTALIPAASILAEVDGTPGTNDMPGRLVFSTTADGASTPTERMRIASTGQFTFTTADMTSANPSAFIVNSTAKAAQTGNTVGVISTVSTDATYAGSSLISVYANQGTLAVAPTSQYGFYVPSGFTGATNNYGFYSNIAAGTGRWNFYANGTAANYFAGETQLANNLAFQGTGNRITGDFNNATAANRVAFQNSTTNAQTILTIIPNGTAVASALAIEGDSAVANGTNATFNLTSTDVRLSSGGRGTFTYLPMTFYTGGFERMRVAADGEILVGGTIQLLNFPGTVAVQRTDATPVISLFRNDTSVITGNILGEIRFYGNDTTSNTPTELATVGGVSSGTHAAGDNPTDLVFQITPDGTELVAEGMRLTQAKNLKIGGTATRATTEGTNQLVMFNGTAPVGTLTNGVSFYSASGEARVMDAAGNSTLLSPHDHDTNEWIFHSKHTPTGKVLRIDVEKMLRFINDHFGLDMIQEFTEE